MRVLVACEFSGVVREAFKALGHDAWSCDLLPSEQPGSHIQGDVLGLLGEGWDLMIAHPPCTYLCKAGARWMYPTAGNIDPNRYARGLEAKAFFEKLLNAPIPRIAVENPTPLKVFELPPPSCVVQPYEHGQPYSKRTLLWLKNLPNLKPTYTLPVYDPWISSNTGGKRRGQSATIGKAKTAIDHARTFPGIAAAMAKQWGQA